MRFRNYVEYTHDLVSAKPSLTGILKQKLSTRATKHCACDTRYSWMG